MISGILLVLLVLSLLLFVIGLISPKVSLFWLEKRSRLKSSVIFLTSAFLCLIIMIVLPNSSSIESEVTNSEVDSFAYWMNVGDELRSDLKSDASTYRDLIYCYENAIRHNRNSYLAYAKRGLAESGLALLMMRGAGTSYSNTDSSKYFLTRSVQDIDTYLASGDTVIEKECFDAKGINLYLLEQFKAAIEIYTYLIYLDPNNSEYYKYRAGSYYGSLKLDSAMSDILIAKSLSPQDEDINRIFLRLQSEM